MKIGHHSSRYDRTSKSFKSAAQLVAEQCAVCTFTEVTQDGNVIPGRDWFTDHGWGTWQPPPGKPAGSDECAFAWDLEVWDLEEHAHGRLSELRWYREGGALAPYTVGLAGLFHRVGTDERWVIGVVHMPANTTDNDGCRVWWNDTKARGDCYKDAMRNLGPWVQSLRQRWGRGGATTLIGGDWNQKCECSWFRDRVRDWMPGEFKVSAGPYPDTIGSSTYDWWIEGQRVVPTANAQTFTSPASDHRFVVRKYARDT